MNPWHDRPAAQRHRHRPGGLASAMLLAKAGVDVTVYEARGSVGGRSSTIAGATDKPATSRTLGRSTNTKANIMPRSSIFALALVFGSLAALPVAAQTAPTAPSNAVQRTTLTVSVSGLRNPRGQVLIWVWNGPDGFPTQAEKRFRLAAIDADKAVNETVTAAFDLPPGTYAVTNLHDENKNGQMDTNFLGIPTEGYGASNNPVSRFGPPSFGQARFQLPASGGKISITTHY